MITHTRGFTLVELLVGIAIIGFLATIVLGQFTGTREKARDVRRVSNLEQLQIALRLYVETNGAYPEDTANGQIGVGGNIDALLEPYLPDPPQDTSHDGSTYYYAYHDAVNCSGVTRPAVYANTMEHEDYQGAGAAGCDVGNADSYVIQLGRE